MFVSLSASTRKLVVSWNAGALACGTARGTLACANQTRVAQPPSAVFRSCFSSVLCYFRIQVAFSDLAVVRSLQPGDLGYPLPLLRSPFLKDLRNSSPCLPICSHCKQRRLPHSSPFDPHF